MTIVGYLGVEEPILVVGPLVNEFILRLRRAELMKEKLVVVNLRAEFVFLIRFVVAAVKEPAAVFFPRRTREFDPVELIRSVFACLDVAHFPLLPIGTGGRKAIRE